MGIKDFLMANDLFQTGKSNPMKLCLLQLSVILLFSCDKYIQDTYEDKFITSKECNLIETSFKDSVIVEAILLYAKENDIDRTAGFFNVIIDGNSLNKVIYISFERLSFLEGVPYPDYYSWVNETLIIINSDADHLLNKYDNVKCYLSLAKSKNLSVDTTITLDHPPVYQVAICNGEPKLSKKPNTPFPCE